jgi:hypothetical protein
MLKTILNVFFITRPSPWRKPHEARRRMHPPSRMLKEGISFVRQAQEAKADIRVHEISLTAAELYANGKYYVFTCSLLWYGGSDCARVSCKASFSDAGLLSPALPITSTVASIQIIALLSLAALR